jgi:hypothetical protein
VSLARSLSSSGWLTSRDRLGDVPPVQYCLGFARRPESSTDGEQLGGMGGTARLSDYRAPMPRRARTLSPLRAFLAARNDSGEEQAVAVLAAALRAEPGLAWRLLDSLAIPERGELVIDTEVLVGDRDGGRVDLQLQVGDDAGDLKRVWIEAKIFARFQRRRHGATQVHQLVGYRRALNRYDRSRYRAASPASSLVALVHSIDRGVDRTAVRVSQTQPITWQIVADLVGEYGVKTYGPDWRQRSSERDSSRGLATLETLVWFLEDAPTPDGTKYVGVEPSNPFTQRSLKLYGQAKSVADAASGLGERVTDSFMTEGWKTSETYESDVSLVYEALLERGPGRRLRWWERQGRLRADLPFQIAPYDERTDPAATTPTLWVGLSLKSPVRRT